MALSVLVKFASEGFDYRTDSYWSVPSLTLYTTERGNLQRLRVRSNHSHEGNRRVALRVTRGQPTSVLNHIHYSTYSPPWVFAYRPLFVVSSLEESTRVQYVASPNGRGTLPFPVMHLGF